MYNHNQDQISTMCKITKKNPSWRPHHNLRLPEWEDKSAALAASAALRKESVELVPAADRGLGSPPQRELPCPATSDIPISQERSLTTYLGPEKHSPPKSFMKGDMAENPITYSTG